MSMYLGDESDTIVALDPPPELLLVGVSILRLL